jgi:glycosyltransferase involved in cell wall biosynthesis|tara:strand:+ start:182 stop:1114 length:933 start_codon:yes stop_codon:yes gene_type:complete
MSQEKLDISVVIPIFNAENTLVELNHQLISFLNGKNILYEVIYVDDHSSDSSWEILQDLQVNNSSIVKVIRLAKNVGQHESLMCGLNFSKGESIVTMDDDLEHSPGDIEVLLEAKKVSNSSILYGMYPSDKSQRVRRMLKRAYRFLSKSEGINKAEGSSFRLLDASIVNNIKKHEYSFIWLDEMFLWYNPNPEFVQLNRVENGANKVSRYSLFKLIGLTFNVMLYTTTIPLRLFIYVGFSLSVINFLIGTFYIIKKLALGSQVGYTSLIVSILFTSGIILIGIGIIGIYLSRLYSLMNKEPRYTIEEKKC